MARSSAPTKSGFLCAPAVAFGGAAFPAATGIHSMTITGPLPNTAYSVTVQPNGNGNWVSVFPGGASATTGSAGVLTLSF